MHIKSTTLSNTVQSSYCITQYIVAAPIVGKLLVAFCQSLVQHYRDREKKKKQF